jgi:hypothetical protein
MSDQLTALDYEQRLIDDIASFASDPLGYVLYAFPWGEPGPLENFDGPDEWQREILEEVGRQLRSGELSPDEALNKVIQMAVSSGHGAGKSMLCAILILWSMSTMPDTRGVVTANTATQLTTKSWAELAKWYSLCINKHWFELTATSLFSRDPGHEKTWRIDAIPWSKEKSEAFAGLHNKGRRILIIFDEASAIPPIIWEVTEGALTDKNTEILWFAFGNPTRNDGRFHDCFYKDSKYWHHKKIDSRTAKMTNKELIADQIDRYGIDSDFIKVRVRGEFPSASVSQYISMDLIDAAKERAKSLIESDLKGVPLIFGLDVARFGDDNSVLWIRRGIYTKRKFTVNGYDTVRLANLLMQHMDQDNPAAVFIDISGGLGAGVYDILNNLGRRKIFPVNFGEKATKDIVYPNKRCEMYGELKEWLIDGGCLPYEGEESEYIAEDLMAIDYFFNNKSQITLEKKEDIKVKLGRSPDDADALALTFAMPVPPDDVIAVNRTVRSAEEYRPLQMKSRSYKPLGKRR